MKILQVLVAATLAFLASGCRSISRPTFEQETRSQKSQIVARSPSQGMPDIAPVGYQELDGPSRDTHSDSARQHSQRELSSHAVTHRTSTAAMSLTEFQSLALDNNPTIQALAATTQKAAGYRTQVGLRPNPVVGYQGV